MTKNTRDEIEETLQEVFTMGLEVGKLNRNYRTSDEKVVPNAHTQVIQALIDQAVEKALLKQALRITSGGRGGTEIFIENIPLDHYIKQLTSSKEE